MKKRERRNDERNEETEGGKSGGVGNYMMKCLFTQGWVRKNI